MAQKFNLALLHGGGQGSWVWSETIAALQSQVGNAGNVVALDIPGCGTKRGHATQDRDPQSVAHELIDDLERAGMKNIVLAGHSLAGNVVPALSELRPDLFRRLIYVSCSIPLPGQTVVELMGKGLHGSNENEVGWPVDPASTSMSERYETMFCEDMNATQRKAFMVNIGQDHWPLAYFSNTHFDFKHATPATYVVCLKDRILPVEWQVKFAARFRAKDLIRVDAGHQVMNSRPHTLAEVLRYAIDPEM